MNKFSVLFLMLICALQACQPTPSDTPNQAASTPETQPTSSASPPTSVRAVATPTASPSPAQNTASAVPATALNPSLRLKLEGSQQTQLELTSEVDASFLYYGRSASKQHVTQTSARYQLDWTPEGDTYHIVSQPQSVTQVITRIVNGQLQITRLDNGQSEDSDAFSLVSIGNLNLPPKDQRFEGVLRSNGEIDSYGEMEPLWKRLLDYAEPSLKTQLESNTSFQTNFLQNMKNLAKTHFQSITGMYPLKAEVKDEESWIARANITENLLGNSLGTITRKTAPTWRLKEVNEQVITLQYRGSLNVRSPQTGESFDLDERGTATLNAQSGLLQELTFALELESNRNAPQVPVTLSLRQQ